MIIITLTLILLILLVGASAFFSSSETAFLSISRITLRQLIKDRKPSAKKIASLKADMDTLITTILVGNNFVNTLASSVASALAISIAGNSAVAIAAAVVTVLIIIFGEVLPKTIASVHPVSTAQKTAGPLQVIYHVLKPVSVLFSLIIKAVSSVEKLFSSGLKPFITEDELKTLIDVGSQEGTLESSERDMLYKIFEFTDLRARDIMRHRSLIKAVHIDSDYCTMVKMFTSTGFSRLPVFKKDINGICGIIHYKDILFYHGDKSTCTAHSIMHDILFVPETLPAVSLLREYKATKQNFSVVIDEHGSIAGIITMDDILKAVFGRITDEYSRTDVPHEERIMILTQNEFRVPGDVPLSVINNVFSLKLESEESETIGGWLLEEFGALPSTGEVLKRNGILFTVEDQAQRRIKSVRMMFSPMQHTART